MSILQELLDEPGLILLCHKLALWQQGHRGSRRAIVRANLQAEPIQLRTPSVRSSSSYYK